MPFRKRSTFDSVFETTLSPAISLNQCHVNEWRSCIDKEAATMNQYACKRRFHTVENVELDFLKTEFTIFQFYFSGIFQHVFNLKL